MLSRTSVGARIVRSHPQPQERTVNCVLTFLREPRSFSHCRQKVRGVEGEVSVVTVRVSHKRCERQGWSGQEKFLLFPPVASIDRSARPPRERISSTGPVMGDEPVGDVSAVDAAERHHSRSPLAHDLGHSQSGTADTLRIACLAGMDFRNSWHVPPITR